MNMSAVFDTLLMHVIPVVQGGRKGLLFPLTEPASKSGEVGDCESEEGYSAAGTGRWDRSVGDHLQTDVFSSLFQPAGV